MRKIRYSPRLLGALVLAPSLAVAQENTGFPVIVPSQSSVYNQNTVNLPTPPPVNGQDIIRGASGVSCQSAVASGGPYLDLGVIGSQDVFNRDTAAVYGRVVVPLGERPKRPDCTELYELEITRLKMELELLRLGLPPAIAGAIDGSARHASQDAVSANQSNPLVIQEAASKTMFTERSSRDPDRNPGE